MHKLLFLGMIIFFLTACDKKNHTFSGYVDAELVYLSADFAGRLVDLTVSKGQAVKSNQFLFRVEQTPERYNVEMSELTYKELLAQRQQILTQLKYNQINYRRTMEMRQENAASQNDLDAARRDLNISQDQLADIDVKIKNNKLETADKKWQMTRKESFAPTPGLVFDTYYTKGEFVAAGSPVLSLVTANNIKAIFFVPEEILDQMRLNEQIKISTDQNPQYARGHISYISNTAEYTPPIIYSRDERQRLVFRVEAKIDSPNLEKIHLGHPVTLELAQ